MTVAAASAASAAVAATSAVFQGISAYQQAEAQEDALEHERKQLLQQRTFLDEAREEEIELFQKETQELLGLQSVGFAKAGVELSGSVLNVLNRTTLEAKEEEDKIYQQYSRYRTMSELKENAISSARSNISHQKGFILPTTVLGAAAGGTSSYYGTKKLMKEFP
tara:strand:+ start:11545 stop:12039 length:495 start_codon:yes stop_codon:yes gene_type:complete